MSDIVKRRSIRAFGAAVKGRGRRAISNQESELHQMDDFGEAARHQHREDGGARRDRTDDLLLAKQALSQLSYGPFRDPDIGNQQLEFGRRRVRRCRLRFPITDFRNWWAWEDLNFRPHAYQARALTS